MQFLNWILDKKDLKLQWEGKKKFLSFRKKTFLSKRILRKDLSCLDFLRFGVEDDDEDSSENSNEDSEDDDKKKEQKKRKIRRKIRNN